MTRVYLCGPINGRSDSDCIGWRQEFIAAWPGECVDPMRRDYRGREQAAGVAAEIVEADLSDIDKGEAVVVYFDRPSVGTAMEVFYAHRAGKRVVVIDKSGEPLSPWLVYHSHAIVASVREAVAALT
jgi:nucleoside 2-deoxyribosyltransferase